METVCSTSMEFCQPSFWIFMAPVVVFFVRPMTGWVLSITRRTLSGMLSFFSLLPGR